MFRFVPQAFLPFLMAFALVCPGLAVVRAQVLDAQDAGHAGLYRPETIDSANKLIERMKEDCGKTLTIETFPRPAWGQLPPALAEAAKSKKSKDEADFIDHANRAQREEYFQGWAHDRARTLGIDGVYVLVCKHPGGVAAVVEPDSNDTLFPKARRAWLQETIWRKFHGGPKDSDLLSEVVPGVWYTVQDLQRNPSQDGAGWSWMPVLAIIGILLASWVGIAVLRVLVGLVRSLQPAKPDLARTQAVAQTTVPYPPPAPDHANGSREDSVDY